MDRIHGLPAFDPPGACFLVLGSFPSRRSLELGRYYGHGRNQFWDIFGGILGERMPAEHPSRLERLRAAGIAIWDLIASCIRESSLDKDIEAEELNPIDAFVEARPSLSGIALNGGRAAAAFFSGFAPELGRGPFAIGSILEWCPVGEPGRRILVSRMPSTSPVPTRDFRSTSDKLPHWRAFFDAVRSRRSG